MLLKILQTLAGLCLLLKGGSFADDAYTFPKHLLEISCLGDPGTRFDLRGKYLAKGCWGSFFCGNDGGKVIKACYPDTIYNNETKLCEMPTIEMNECNKLVLCRRKRNGFHDIIHENKAYQIKCLNRKYVQLIDCSTATCLDIDDDNLG